MARKGKKPVAEETPPDLTGVTLECRKCGRVDSTLRASSFMYVASGVFITVRRPASSGIFCASHRRNEAIKWSLMTGVLGWWGIPWGPIYTVQVLVRNAKGGRQDAALNAALLKATGQALVDRGDTPEAIRALDESTRLRADPEASELLGQVRGYYDAGHAG